VRLGHDKLIYFGRYLRPFSIARDVRLGPLTVPLTCDVSRA
jgi:hypothetical protein